MMQHSSNYTKASFFFHDISDSTFTAKREQSFTLQQFSYECSRKRNSRGEPYGPTLASILRFTLKSLPDGYLKEFYQRLTENTVSCFSIVSNAVFQSNGFENNVLSDYDSALVVTGQVVDIDEAYHTEDACKHPGTNGKNEVNQDLMMITVDFLLQSITYIGSNNYKKELPIHY